MLMGIAIREDEYRRMTDEQKLDLLEDAFFRARQLKEKATIYAKRLDILNRPVQEILDERQESLVRLLEEGYLD